MKIVQINTVPNGSTGTIMMNIHKALLAEGHDSYVVWGRGRKAKNEHEIYLGDKIGVILHVLYSRLTGKTGFASKHSTKKLLKELDKIKPEIIHLHNIHGYFINIELLFNYIKKNNIRVIWTLHDCWAFTGHCTHFEYIGCEKWKKECKNCEQLKEYPKSFIDKSKWCLEKKKELFLGVNNLTLVTPSDWLNNLVKQSFLKDYEVITIHNGIDTNIFRPLPKKVLQFRKKYGLEDKKIILGVASIWTNRKGLNDFIELSKELDDNYKIVLVGLSKKQIHKMPKNILGIERTENVQELVEIYNSADVFFNPTYEDNYPNVNLEANSCGIHIIAYNTGGNEEFCIANKENIIANKNSLKDTIINSLKTKKMAEETRKDNDIKNMINRYKSLYMEEFFTNEKKNN